MPDNVVDAFILFNEQESKVQRIVEMLEERRVSTYFWRRDIGIGQPWTTIEQRQLAEAKTVVIFSAMPGGAELTRSWPNRQSNSTSALSRC